MKTQVTKNETTESNEVDFVKHSFETEGHPEELIYTMADNLAFKALVKKTVLVVLFLLVLFGFMAAVIYYYIAWEPYLHHHQ